MALPAAVCIMFLSFASCALGMESTAGFDSYGEQIMGALEKNGSAGGKIGTGIVFDSREKAEEFGSYFYRECYLGDENLILGIRPAEKNSSRCEIVGIVKNPVEAVAQHKRAKAALREITAQNEVKDPYITAVNLYQWIYEHVNYDDTMKHHSVYSAIIGGSTVCYGYARAYKNLCQYSGLECELVYGDNHVWNRVKINGEWKYVDITWNKSLGKHRWMFLTAEEMGDHLPVMK